MSSKPTPDLKTVDRLLKAMVVFSRTANHVLESHAIEAAAGEVLSSSKVQTLRLLGERGEQMSTRVARFLGVTKPAVSQIIDSMVQNGLVVRRGAKEDRREVRLRLTAKGQRLFQNLRREQRHLVRNAVRQANANAANRWAKALLELIEGLTQADKAFKDFCLQCAAHGDPECVLVGGEAECLFLQHEAQPPGRSKSRRSRK